MALAYESQAHESDAPRQRAVLDFWFGPEPRAGAVTEEYVRQRMPLWFGGAKSTDELIRKRFAHEVERARAGEYRLWEHEPEACLALIVLLDQFALNIYRDEARSFLSSAQAIPIALRAIDKGFDQRVHPIQRVFYYLPLEHAEDLSLQERSVELFRKLVEEAPAGFRTTMEVYLDYAIRHYDVIARFGRFPDRNEMFRREPTASEAEYMAQGGPPF